MYPAIPRMYSAFSSCSPEVDYYRRSDRGMSLSIAPNSPMRAQYDTGSIQSRNDSPHSDADNKNGAVPPRKRVPVACGRCRKRKIKCSGDLGRNKGCSNCENAGFQACQFLRVQSNEVPVVMHYQASRNWQINRRFEPYGLPSANRSKYTAGNQHYSEGLGYSGAQIPTNFDSYAVSSPQVSWNRSTYSTQYPINYGDVSTNHYDAQPPSYMLPQTDPMGNINSCYMSAGLGRISQPSLWTEQVNSTSQSVPNNHGVLNSPFIFQSADQNTTFQSLNSSSSDRILPTPPRGLAAAPVASVDSMSMNALSQLSHRSSFGWSSTDTPSSHSTSGASSRTSSNSVSAESDSRTGNGTATGTTADLAYNFLGVSQDLLQSSALSSANGLSQTQSPKPVSTETELRMHRSRESMVPSPTEMVRGYGYQSARFERGYGQRTLSNGSEDHLTDGLSYNRPTMSDMRGPVQQPNCSQSGVDHIADNGSGHSQRGSVASISNSSGF